MAPPEAVKSTPKKSNVIKGKSSTVVKKAAPKVPLAAGRAIPLTAANRQRTNTVPKVTTPTPKENKSVPSVAPNSVTKKAKVPLWKRTHYGIPVPEKMRKLQERLREAKQQFLAEQAQNQAQTENNI